jgi:hypothetical protein
MRLCLLVLTWCVACATPSPYEEPPVDSDDDEQCSADFEITYPGGAVSSVPCVNVSMDATMEFDPDDPPELRTIEIEVDGSESVGFECSVRVEISGLCGLGSYPVGSAVSVDVVTFDCEGTPDAFEGTVSAFSGTVQLTLMSTSEEVGNLTGRSVPVEVAGSLDLQLADGAALRGPFHLEEAVVGEDAEELACANQSVTQVLPLVRGELAGTWTAGGGVERSYSYTLGIGGGVAPVGCPSCDVVGNLTHRNLVGEPYDDRSGELAVFGVQTSTGVAYELDGGVWREWGDGFVGSRRWEGSSVRNNGGLTIEESLTLEW